jgi:anti-anti-sigma factor
MIAYQENKFVLFQPCGRLDLEGGITLRQQLGDIKPNCHTLWIVDLNYVDFIDSSGLLALVVSLNFAIENQCRLVLCNLHPSVKLVFEITRLDQVFEMIDATNETELSVARFLSRGAIAPSEKAAA